MACICRGRRSGNYANLGKNLLDLSSVLFHFTLKTPSCCFNYQWCVKIIVQEQGKESQVLIDTTVVLICNLTLHVHV